MSQNVQPPKTKSPPQKCDENGDRLGVSPDETLESTVEWEESARSVGPYTRLEPLSEGGMGRLYRAWDGRLQRHVAIKVIKDKKGAAPIHRARFWREARALAALNHPGIVTIFEMGESESGELYIAMELLEGETLRSFLGQPWSIPAFMALALPLSEALAVAHRAGIVHRDLKPANIFITEGGRVKILDFGIARNPFEDEVLTQEGIQVGTPSYMSPEQLQGRDIGPESDIFALGILFYQLITGVHPFKRGDLQSTALALSQGTYPPFEAYAHETPQKIAKIIKKCLNLTSGQRYLGAEALFEALVSANNDQGQGEAHHLKSLLLPEGMIQGPDKTGPMDRKALPSESLAPLIPEGIDGGVPAEKGSAEYRAKGPSKGVILGSLSLILCLLLGAYGVLGGFKGQETPPLSLPPMPVFTVLPFESEADGVAAGVLADALRHHLSFNENSLYIMSLESLYGRDLLEAEPKAASLQALAKENRAWGHVDVVIRGELSRQGEGHYQLDYEWLKTQDASPLYRGRLEFEKSELIFVSQRLAKEAFQLIGDENTYEIHPLSQTVEAHAALLNAQAASRGNRYAEAQGYLAEALRLEPQFALARVEELALLRSERRMDEVQAGVEALLAQDKNQLPPPVRALVGAWQAYGAGETLETYQRLGALIQRWPYEVEAYYLLLVILFSEPEIRSLKEASRVAEALLAIAPASEVAASRLVRAFGYRGLIGDAERILEAAGFSAEDPKDRGIFAEMNLFLGEYDQALRVIEAILDESGESIYYEHLAIIAHLLANRCDRAAVMALNRIAQIEARGADANLDWTYSLAVQSLICEREYGALDGIIDRWMAHSASGRTQGELVYLHTALLGDGGARFTEGLLVKRLGEMEPAELLKNPGILGTLARVGTDTTQLATYRALVKSAMVDLSNDAAKRSSFERLGKMLDARMALLMGEKNAYALYKGLLKPWDEVESEGQLPEVLETVAATAEAFEVLGHPDEARALWTQIEGLGMRRLWRTDLWILAQNHLGRGGDE